MVLEWQSEIRDLLIQRDQFEKKDNEYFTECM